MPLWVCPCVAFFALGCSSDPESNGEATLDAPELGSSSQELTASEFDGIINGEAAWIAARAQGPGAGTPAGRAVVIHSDWDTSTLKWRVLPYDANLAVTGMLEKGTLYQNVAKDWINWYCAHMNFADYNGVNGTVYDYYLHKDTGALTQIQSNGHGTYDSTDSYAATFLSLLRKYKEKTGDAAFLDNADKKYCASAALGAVLASKQSDGLTWAKPDYQAKYLMDNAEVYKGFVDAAWLYQNVFTPLDSSAVSYYNGHATEVKNGILAYHWKSNAYTIAPPDAVSWNWLNPLGAQSQVWPVLFGVLPATDSKSLTVYRTGLLGNNLVSKFPNFTTTVNNPDGAPWASLCYAAALMGDKPRADACVTGLRNGWINASHRWPYNVREAAFTIMAAAKTKTLP